MNTTIQFIFVLNVLITLFMGVLTYLSYKRHKDKELLHLTELWGSLMVNALAFIIFSNQDSQMMAFAMVGWIWPLKTFKLMLQDISGEKNLILPWQLILLLAGGFITIALWGYGYSFTQLTLPFSIAVGVYGLSIILKAKQVTPREFRTVLHWGIYILMGAFFIERFTYPFWRLNPELSIYGIAVEIFVLIGFAGLSLSTYMELIKKRHDVLMGQMMKDRNEKLLSQSKYSELGMMAAGIAHEINNPLAVIQARTTQLLRIYRNPEKQQDLADGLQQILYTSERINRSILGMREFVHQDEHGPATEIALKDLFDDVLVFCGQRLKNHGVNLRIYGFENYTVVGNKVQLEQIILNLLNNSFDAIEFLPDKWIEVSCIPEGEKLHLYFKDSGHGIPPEIASRIMDPFFSTKGVGKGTGLGLALARGIAEKHGGSLEYVSDAPFTTFKLDLPRDHQSWGAALHH